MANLAPNGYNAALARLPNEICDAIFELLTSARDSVCMILAFEKHCASWDAPAAWTKLFLKHKHNILPDPYFCELFEWDGNSKFDWDDMEEMEFMPADWTRLPAQSSYAEMMYCYDCFPAYDLDGNDVTEDRFLECLWKEQEQIREECILQSYLRRTDQDNPSSGSRVRLNLADEDTRNYKQLLDNKLCLSRRQNIEGRRIDDEKDRSRELGQPQAFRKVFCELTLNKNFEPTACQGCLTYHVIPYEPDVNWEDHIEGWDMRRLRFCLDCAVHHANSIEYARSRSISYVSVEELRKYSVELLDGYYGEDLWCNIIEHFYSPCGKYVLLGDADQLCMLRHNLPLKDLQFGQLPQSVLQANGQIYNFAARVANDIIKLHRLPIWSDIELGDDDDESFEFWSGAISWAKSRAKTENIDVPNLARDDPTIAALAEKYWEDFISIHLQRV